jgi:phosphopantothenoylcysteine synthetase/decarboxylase
LECEPTQDIAAAAGRMKLPHQRTIGFSLESEGNINRAAEKLRAKNLDLIVFNPTQTIGSDQIAPVLIYPDGRTEPIPTASKDHFAEILLQRAISLWPAAAPRPA